MAYLLNNFNGNIANPKTLFESEIKEQKLIFKFEALNSCLYSYSDTNNSDLWRGCVCEVFLDLGDEFYYEFEVAPNGATFIAKILDRHINYIEPDFFNSTSRIIGNDYYVSIEIDLSKLNNPKKIKYNAFRIEASPNKKEQILSALNPTLCDTFHIRDKFLTVDL